MAPEYGATCGFFPIDGETLRYLRNTGRDEDRIALVEAYAKENGFWRGQDYDPIYTSALDLDTGSIVPAISGPRRPQDSLPLTDAARSFYRVVAGYRGIDVGLDAQEMVDEGGAVLAPPRDPRKTVAVEGKDDKGTALLGIKAVIDDSFERIHRSNLVGMGVIPFEFSPRREPQKPWSQGRRSGDNPGSCGRSEAAFLCALPHHLCRRDDEDDPDQVPHRYRHRD